PSGKGRAAAVATLTLTGAKLLYEGQLDGWKVRLPVFLARRPAEPIDQDLAAFYHDLLKTIHHDVFRNGQWRLCERSGWPDNQSFRNILTWCWVKDEERVLIVVNFSDRTSQALIHVPWEELRGKTWRLTDALSGEVHERSGSKMRDSGLYVDLPPWGYHVFALGS
ncbi:MAG: alpha-amylase, partial [Betaproteobacteria bacterium]